MTDSVAQMTFTAFTIAKAKAVSNKFQLSFLLCFTAKDLCHSKIGLSSSARNFYACFDEVLYI